MDDMNLVLLEGNILYEPNVQDKESKKAYNFIVSSVHYTRTGNQEFKFPCVLWEYPESSVNWSEKLKSGTFVRIQGHLQEAAVRSEDKTIYLCKVCVDSIKFEK